MASFNPANTQYGQAESGFTSGMQGQQQATNQLAQLLRDPSMIKQTAGYQFAVDQGNQAINRSAAARGGLNSGGVLAELAKYGQGMASQEYGNQVNQLSNLANLYGNQQQQAGQFLLGANAGPYQRAGLNPWAQGSATTVSQEFGAPTPAYSYNTRFANY